VAFYDNKDDFKRIVGSVYKSHIRKVEKRFQENAQIKLAEKNSEIEKLKEKEPNLDLYLIDENKNHVKELAIRKTPYEYRKAFVEEVSDTKQNTDIDKFKLLYDTFRPKDEEIINYINSINHMVVVKLVIENKGNYIAKNFNVELFSSDGITFENELPQRPKGNLLDFDSLKNIPNIIKKNYEPVIVNENNIRFKVDELIQGYTLNLREIFLHFENNLIGKKFEFKYIIVGENCKEKTGKFYLSIELQPLQTINYERIKNKSSRDLI
jgi:hypothetical protein